MLVDGYVLSVAKTSLGCQWQMKGFQESLTRYVIILVVTGILRGGWVHTPQGMLSFLRYKLLLFILRIIFFKNGFYLFSKPISLTLNVCFCM